MLVEWRPKRPGFCRGNRYDQWRLDITKLADSLRDTNTSAEVTEELRAARAEGYLILDGAVLHDVDLHSANLSHAYLMNANLHGVDLSHANLNRADLRGANLCNADLRFADLDKANLKDANLEGANLKDANLRHAKLDGANLTRVTLPDGSNY